MSYYTDNNRMLFRLRNGEFEQLITLTELEDMLPYERSAYFIMMKQKIDERQQQKARK